MTLFPFPSATGNDHQLSLSQAGRTADSLYRDLWTYNTTAGSMESVATANRPSSSGGPAAVTSRAVSDWMNGQSGVTGGASSSFGEGQWRYQAQDYADLKNSTYRFYPSASAPQEHGMAAFTSAAARPTTAPAQSYSAALSQRAAQPSPDYYASPSRPAAASNNTSTNTALPPSSFSAATSSNHNQYAQFQNLLDAQMQSRMYPQLGLTGSTGPTTSMSMNGYRNRVLSLPENALIMPSDPYERPATSGGLDSASPFAFAPPPTPSYDRNILTSTAPYNLDGRPNTAGSSSRHYPFSHDPFPIASSRPNTGNGRPDTGMSIASTSTVCGNAFEGYPPGPKSIDPATGEAGNRVYQFVGQAKAHKKRPRRKFDEIERMYDCAYTGCTKSYGVRCILLLVLRPRTYVMCGVSV